MTANTQEYIAFVVERLAPLKALSSGRFFGGTRLCVGDLQFGMMMGNTLFFVVDATTRKQYEAMGMGCFWYNTKKGRRDVKKYYEVPGDLLDEPQRLLALARESIAVARRLKR